MFQAPPPPSFHNSKSRIQQNPPRYHTLLRTIHVSSPPSHRELYNITATTLKSLLRFINLEHLLVNLGGGVDINDETVHDASKAWPKLNTLEIPE